MQLTNAIKIGTGSTWILMDLLFEKGLVICANIFVKDFADSYSSHETLIKNVKVLSHFLYLQYMLEIVCSGVSTQIVSLLKVGFVTLQLYSSMTVSITFDSFFSGPELDRSEKFKPEQTAGVSSIGYVERKHHTLLWFLIKQNKSCISSPYCWKRPLTK